MNEEKQSIVKAADTRLPKFVENAYESIEQMTAFAKILLDSKLVPSHFFEKLPDGKPDFSKGKVEAVVVVLIQAHQLQLPPLTALQHIIPVNGLLSIKGDLAKSMIFNSGKLKTDSWKEEEFGSIDSDDYVVKITATRSDNGQTITRSFSVAQAKRAGLWVTTQQVSASDGWKYKASAWYKYPARMINYRALGFLARDLFPDVMAGIYTTEEAADIPQEIATTIDQGNGVTLQIPDKQFAQERDKKITTRAVEKIKAEPFAPVKEEAPLKKSDFSSNMPSEAFNPKHADAIIKIAEESPFIPQKSSVETFEGKIIRRNGVLLDEPEPIDHGSLTNKIEGSLTTEQMSKMPTEDLLAIVNASTDMAEATMIIPGKNTNKKLREIIFAHQNGKLDEYLAEFREDPMEEAGNAAEPVAEEPTNADIKPNKSFEEEKVKADADLTARMQEEAPPKVTMLPIEDFLEKPTTQELNKYKMEILPFNKGEERDFASVKEMFYRLNTVSPKLDNERFLAIKARFPEFDKYKNKEDFLKYATVAEICSLLNKN
jgi:hypothetical protein